MRLVVRDLLRLAVLAALAGAVTLGPAGAGSTSTTLTATPSAVEFGQTVTLKATVDGADATPSGTVTFYRGGSTTVGTGSLSAVAYRKIVNGNYYSCGLLDDGSVQCWGANESGQLGDGTTTARSYPIRVPGLVATDVAAGATTACALLVDATVACWGGSSEGQAGVFQATQTTPSAISGLSGVTAIAPGTRHACALKSDGTVVCWGRNSSGQLGRGTTGSADLSLDVVKGVSNATAIFSSNDYSCALINTGSVRCWGSTTAGQIDPSTRTVQSESKAVPGISTATAIAGGRQFVCAILQAKTVSCWGTGVFGQLGNGSQSFSARSPAVISNLANVTRIAASDSVVCVTLEGGGARCWGLNTQGVIGSGSSSGSTITPTVVVGISDASRIAVGNAHVCTVSTTGSAVCWGGNSYGQLGMGDTAYSAWPVRVGSLEATALASDNIHTCVVTPSSTVSCWGSNSYGQLGTGTTTNSSVPVTVPGLSDVVAVETGVGHSCAQKSDGTVWCWGLGSEGELGNGAFVNSGTPVQVSGIETAASLHVGGLHSCVILTDRTVQCWGYNMTGELGNGGSAASSVPVTAAGLSDIVDLALGQSHTCALLADKTVKCFGYNDSGQLGDGTVTTSRTPVSVRGLSDVTAIDAGSSTNCALISDGTLRCWGENAGKLGTGTYPPSNTPVAVPNVSTVTQFSVGRRLACARLADATARCWGDNYFGELGDGTTSVNYQTATTVGLSDISTIQAGDNFACAVRSDQSVWCWGGTAESGQLGTGKRQYYNDPRLTGVVATRSAATTTASLARGTHSVTAAFAGAGGLDASTSDAVTVSVTGKNAQTISFTGPTDRAYSPAPIALSATATSGLTVTFTSTTEEVCTVAAATLTLVGIGTCSITASQPGDGDTEAATPVTQSFTISKGTPTLTLSARSRAVVGDAALLTVRLRIGGIDLSGPVNLAADGSVFATVAATDGLAVGYSGASLAVGSHVMTAVYDGSALYDSVTSSAVPLEIVKAGTTTTLALPAAPVAGAPQTLTATVAVRDPGYATVSGTVVFRSDDTELGTVAIVDRTATLSVPSLPPGGSKITAEYSGNESLIGSRSGGSAMVVGRASTETTLAAPATAVTGETVRLTATVAPQAPATGTVTGTVVFKIDGTTIGSATLDNGTASFDTSRLTAGARSVTADYRTSTAFQGSSSNPATVTVSKADTTVTLTAPAGSTWGATVRLVATVGVTAPASGKPSGTVTFLDGTTELGQASLANGTARIDLTGLALGAHSVTARYDGSDGFNAATSDAAAFSVETAPTRVSARINGATTVLPGTPVAVAAQVKATTSGLGEPDGSFVVHDGGDELCGALLHGGAAWCNAPLEVTGDHDLTVTYRGTETFAASTATVGVKVDPRVGRPAVVTGSADRNDLYAAAAPLANGGRVVVWASQVGFSSAVYARRYLPSDAFAGPAVRVDQSTGGASAGMPAVAALPGGGFVVVWTGVVPGTGTVAIFMRRYGVAGDALSNQVRIDQAPGLTPGAPAVAVASDGTIAAVWQSADMDAGTATITARRFGATGVPLEDAFTLSAASTASRTDPAIVAGPDGFVAAYVGLDPNEGRILARSLPTSGEAGDEARVDNGAGEPGEPALAASTGAGVVLAFAAEGPSNGPRQIYVRRLQTAPSVATDGAAVMVDDVSHGDVNPTLAALPNGTVVVAWTSDYELAQSGVEIARLDAELAIIDPAQPVPVNRSVARLSPALEADSDDGFALAFSAEMPKTGGGTQRDVYLQRYGLWTNGSQ